MAKPLRVPIRLYVTLDEEAQEAWMENYGVSRDEIKDDVKRYFGNEIAGDDFKDRIGAAISIEWK